MKNRGSNAECRERRQVRFKVGAIIALLTPRFIEVYCDQSQQAALLRAFSTQF